MRFVPSKSIEQQGVQALHRVRSRLIGCRTQLGNQIRGLLAEYGIVLPLHLSQVRKALPQLIEEENSLLSGMGRQLLGGLYEELCALERRIEANDFRRSVIDFTPIDSEASLRLLAEILGPARFTVGLLCA